MIETRGIELANFVGWDNLLSFRKKEYIFFVVLVLPLVKGIERRMERGRR